MANLYDYSLREVVTVPDSEVTQKVGNGSHSFLKGETIHVLDPQGNIFNLPAEEGHLALEQGYKYAGAKDVEQAKLKEFIADRPSSAALLGFLRSLSFGYSDKLLTDAGVDPNTLKAYRDLNPIANVVGEVGGVLTPFSPVGSTAKVLTKATQGFVGKALAKKGLEGTGRIAGGVAGGAVEGTVTATPFAVSSMVLDESPELAAEQMIAGSQFGTVFGGIGGILAQSLNFSAQRGKKLADHLFYRSFGARSPEYNKLTYFGKNRDRMGEIGRRLKELNDQGAIKSMSDHEQILEELRTKLIPETGSDLNDLILGMKKLTDTGFFDDVLPKTEDIAQKMRDAVNKEFSVGGEIPDNLINSPYGKKVNRLAQKEIEAFEKLGGKLNFFDLETQKRIYQSLKNWDKAPPSNQGANIHERIFGVMSGVLRKESERTLEAIEDVINAKLSPRFTGQNGKGILVAFREQKKLYGDLRDMEMLLSASVRREAVNNTLSLTDIISGGSIGGGMIATSDSFLTGGLGGAAGFIGGALARRYLRDQGELLAARAVDSMADYGLALNRIGKTQQKIDQGVRALMKGGTVTAVKVIPDTEPIQKKEENFKKIKKDLDEVMSNDGVIMARLTEAVPDGNEELQRSLMTTMMRQANFLHSKIPKNPSANLQIINNEEYVPAPTELSKFFRYNQIVNDPLKTLDHLKAGTLTPEHREALVSVYPELYKEMQEQILKGLAEGKPNMSLPQKIQLSIFMGKPVDPTMTYLKDFQMSYMDQGGDQMGTRDRKIKGLKEQAQTDIERVV